MRASLLLVALLPLTSTAHADAIRIDKDASVVEISFLPTPTLVLAGKNNQNRFVKLRVVSDGRTQGVSQNAEVARATVETKGGAVPVPEVTVRVEPTVFNSLILLDTQYSVDIVMTCEAKKANRCRLTRFGLASRR